MGLGALDASGQVPITDVPAGDKPYVQKNSGTRFPVRIGGFVRTGVSEYDKDPDDISAGYAPKDSEHPFKITIYSYTGDRFQNEHGPQLDAVELGKRGFDGAIYAVKHYSPDATIVDQGPFSIKAGGREYKGWRAEFGSKTGIAGYDGRVGSQLYVFPVGKWQIKCRATYSMAAPEVDEGIKQVLQGITWPTKAE